MKQPPKPRSRPDKVNAGLDAIAKVRKQKQDHQRDMDTALESASIPSGPEMLTPLDRERLRQNALEANTDGRKVVPPKKTE